MTTINVLELMLAVGVLSFVAVLIISAIKGARHRKRIRRL